MAVIPLYIPDIHDGELLKWHKLGHDDNSIGDLMRFTGQEIGKQRKRLKLGTNRPPTHRNQERVATGKPDPLALAQDKIPGFDRLNLTVNGKAIKLQAAMTLLNRILKKEGSPQVGPESWHV